MNKNLIRCCICMTITIIIVNSQLCGDYSMSRCNICRQMYGQNQALCQQCVVQNNRCCFNPTLRYIIHPAVTFCSSGSGRTCDVYNLRNCLYCRNYRNCLQCVLQSNQCCVNPSSMLRVQQAQRVCSTGRTCFNYDINRCRVCIGQSNCLGCFLDPGRCCINPALPNAMMRANMICQSGGRTCDFYNINQCAYCRNNPSTCSRCVQLSTNCCVNPQDPFRLQRIEQFCGSRVCNTYNTNNCAYCIAPGSNCIMCILNSQQCCINPQHPNRMLIAQSFCAGTPSVMASDGTSNNATNT